MFYESFSEFYLMLYLDYENVYSAYMQMKDVVSQINEALKEKDNVAKILEIQNRYL